MSRYNVYKPIDNLYIMIIKNFIWGMCGIILGIIINNTVIFLSKVLQINNLLVQNIIQLSLCSYVLALIHSLYHFFGWSWQNITPGLFFISFFFGIQIKIFSNIQNTYMYNL